MLIRIKMHTHTDTHTCIT